MKVYAAVVEKPGDAFPNASEWYQNVDALLAKRFVNYLITQAVN